MPPSEIHASGPARGRSVPLPALAGSVALLAGLLYLNALPNPFVYDDYRLILENSSILNLWDLRGIVYRDMTRPLVNLSYAIDTALWGRAPFGFHVTSVLLHMVNVWLVLYLAWALAEDRRRQRDQLLPAVASSRVIATATALLFAAHPLMTQAVGYISGRSEVLYTALFLLAFFAARRWMLHGGRRWWVAATGLWALALLAKETAAMLGIVLLCYDRLVLEGDAKEKRRRLLRLHVPLLAAATAAAVLRVSVLTLVEYPDQAPVDWRFTLVAFDVFWRYLMLLAMPRGQSVFHDVPLPFSPLTPGAIAGTAGLVVLLLAAWRFRRTHSVLALGVFWFVLLLVPSGVLFALGRGEPMAEHRAYGASIGVFLGAGSAFGMLAHRFVRRGRAMRWLFFGLCALFVIQLCGRTMIRNAVWRDPVALSREAARLSPGHWMPRLLLGEALRTSGRCDQAIAQYQTAIALRPADQFGHTKLAACLIETGRLDEAAAALERLETVSPGSPQASTGLGILAVLRNRPDEGRRHFLKTLERSPSDRQARQLLAFVEGTLREEESRGVCSELERLSAAPLLYDGCAQGDRRPGETPEAVDHS